MAKFHHIIMISVQIVLIDASLSRATILKVPQDFPTIQEAVNAAVPGDTVLLADGIYGGTLNRNIDFHGKSIVLTSENGPGSTSIDCDHAGRGICLVSSETRDAVISGITIEKGFDEIAGGGIYVDSASPTISNCIIKTSRAQQYGGGLYLNGSDASIIDTLIVSNSVVDEFACSGGGIYIDGVSNVVIIRCQINSNKAIGAADGDTQVGSGGGLCSAGSTSVILTECVFEDNEVFGYMACGGGGAFLGGYSDVTNCLFIDNNSFLDGAGIWAGFNDISDVNIRNCTFYNNNSDSGRSSGVYGSNGTVDIINCILWDTEPVEIQYYYADVTVSYSDIRGGYFGTHNIQDDPCFITGFSGSFYLKQTYAGQSENSPCLNAGDSPSSSVCYPSIEGQVCMSDLTTRTDNGSDIETVDMGFHYTGGITISTPTPTITPDPTSTPQPTQTSSPVPSASPTPVEWSGILLALPGSPFSAGDPFRLTAICRSDKAGETDIYILLEIDGQFWFWPGWTQEIDCKKKVLERTLISMNILDFIWPELNTGPVDGFRFLAALMESDTYQLIGDIDVVEFGYY